VKVEIADLHLPKFGAAGPVDQTEQPDRPLAGVKVGAHPSVQEFPLLLEVQDPPGEAAWSFADQTPGRVDEDELAVSGEREECPTASKSGADVACHEGFDVWQRHGRPVEDASVMELSAEDGEVGDPGFYGAVGKAATSDERGPASRVQQVLRESGNSRSQGLRDCVQAPPPTCFGSPPGLVQLTAVANTDEEFIDQSRGGSR
jgi:hypothetical protein